MKADEPRQNRIPFMMSDSELEAVDEWRYANKIATRAEAIRRLCQIGLRFDRAADSIVPAMQNFGQRLDTMARHLEGYAHSDAGNQLDDAQATELFEYTRAMSYCVADLAVAIVSAEVQRLDLTDASKKLTEVIENANDTFARFDPIIVKHEKQKP